MTLAKITLNNFVKFQKLLLKMYLEINYVKKMQNILCMAGSPLSCKSCRSCKSCKNGRFWKKSCKIMYFFNHLGAKAALLSSPNIHFFENIFKNVFTWMFQIKIYNWSWLFWCLSLFCHTCIMKMELTWAW